jgi:hypothetical protein
MDWGWGNYPSWGDYWPGRNDRGGQRSNERYSRPCSGEGQPRSHMMWFRETQKALVVCLYAWAFFAVTLGVATCVHLAQSLF